jgi:UDP-N-acetylglucosamine 1-carboxyvinyltransferase
VTGTANVLCAAVLAKGTTIIDGAAREPEIVDLGMFLNALGARVSGLGSATLEVDGVDQLGGGHHRLIADRIEAATLLLAAAITRGIATVTELEPRHLEAVLAALVEIGCGVETDGSSVTVRGDRELHASDLTARPYPGIPTDLQAQFTTLLTLAAGRSRIRDEVFPERFSHVAALRRFGAELRRTRDGTIVQGAAGLHGADCTASDLRASAALVLAGLAAAGRTLVRRIHHLDRGYESLETKLATLGACIRRIDMTAKASRPAKAALLQPPR